MLKALKRSLLGAILAAGACQALPALAQDETILVSFSNAAYPFFQAVRAHAEDEARRLGVHLVFADGKGDLTDQGGCIENAIAAGHLDGVLLAANDVYALVPSVNYALAKSTAPYIRYPY